MLSYRHAVKADADLLISLYDSAFYQDFLRYGECPAYGKTRHQMEKSIERFSKEIIIYNNTPVGVISVANKGNGNYFIGCLCVIPEFQNMGIGAQAINHFLESHPDCNKISLVTPLDKKENIRFYTKKCGFKIDGTEFDGTVLVARLIRERS